VIRALPLLAIAIALAASGCGSDSSGETTPPAFSVPAITSPISPTSTAPLTTTKSAPTKSTTTTKGGNSFDRNKPDSPTNDVPPPTGSPQEAFEKQCEQNPQACG
jgi:hypothetical protein